MTISQRMERLLSNEDFNEIFMKKYLDEDIKEQVYMQNLDEKLTIDQLKARQIFRQFIEYMLDYDKINQIQKGD